MSRALLCAVLLAACNLGGDLSLGEPGGGRCCLERRYRSRRRGRRHARRGHRRRGDGRGSGPITLVARGVDVLAERLCDVDGDGDGLERFEVDGHFRVDRCIDGDGTVIEGHDCWRDTRIADGFSLTFRVDYVSATLARRECGWNQRSCRQILPETERSSTHWWSIARFRDMCPSHRPAAEDLVACEQVRCLAECPQAPIGCRECAERECGDELAACLDAPPCCAEPPEESIFPE